VVERAVRPVGHAPRAASALDGLKAQPA
jgi:hypothetical protein